MLPGEVGCLKTWDYESYEQYIYFQKKKRAGKAWKKRGRSYYKLQIQYLTSIIDPLEVRSVICQGVRNSNEVKMFRKIFKRAEIFGTDIGYGKWSERIIKIDFTECPREWEKKFDVLYSNSLDHAYDVAAAIREWKRITKCFMVIEVSFGGSTWSDPSKFESWKEVYLLLDRDGSRILNINEQIITVEIQS